MRKLNKRLASLEQRSRGEPPAMLIMPDGRTEMLRGNYMSELLSGACGGERTPLVDLVARSVSSTEPGGGHMIELARAILNSPA